jgi:hypothetical protein
LWILKNIKISLNTIWTFLFENATKCSKFDVIFTRTTNIKFSSRKAFLTMYQQKIENDIKNNRINRDFVIRIVNFLQKHLNLKHLKLFEINEKLKKIWQLNE